MPEINLDDIQYLPHSIVPTEDQERIHQIDGAHDLTIESASSSFSSYGVEGMKHSSVYQSVLKILHTKK